MKSKKSLWKDILKNSKASFQESVDNNGKPYNTVANMGLSVGGKSVCSSAGEYTGLSVETLEEIRPLLTSHRVSRAVKLLDQKAIQTAGEALNVTIEMQKYGMNVVYNIVNVWLKKNDFDVPEEFNKNKLDIKLDKKLIEWILTVRNEPINAKIKIVSIGKSKKGNSVVPESWLDREFNNSKELHAEMDKLDWRKGKPPVNYCCIYSMSIVEEFVWTKIKNLNLKLKIRYVFSISFNKELNVEILKDYNKLNKSSKCLPYKSHSEIVLFVVDDNIIEFKSLYSSNEETVGQLVSRLQKCIRRGRTCSKTLYDCVYKLYKAKPYNLPDQQYLKVSGCRQLFWRSFISIIEDVEPYKESSRYLSLNEIFILAFLCQVDPNIQIKKDIIDLLAYTMLLIQHNDKFGTNWKWHKGDTEEVRNDHYLNLALYYMPMMKNDRTMLIKSYNYLKTYKLEKLGKLSINKLLEYSTKKSETGAILASYDMHCLPNMIIELQGSLPSNLLGKLTTKEISGMIWDYSSSLNVRNKDND